MDQEIESRTQAREDVAREEEDVLVRTVAMASSDADAKDPAADNDDDKGNAQNHQRLGISSDSKEEGVTQNLGGNDLLKVEGVSSDLHQQQPNENATRNASDLEVVQNLLDDPDTQNWVSESLQKRMIKKNEYKDNMTDHNSPQVVENILDDPATQNWVSESLKSGNSKPSQVYQQNSTGILDDPETNRWVYETRKSGKNNLDVEQGSPLPPSGTNNNEEDEGIMAEDTTEPPASSATGTHPLPPNLARNNRVQYTPQPGAIAVGRMEDTITNDDVVVDEQAFPSLPLEDAENEPLHEARLVEEDENEIVEAEPALDGIKAILHNRSFRVVVAVFLLVLLVVVVPLTVFLPSNANSNDNAINKEFIFDPEFCGTRSRQQKDYVGKVAVTVDNIPCQRWDSQSPHTHSYSDVLGAAENYCRNPVSLGSRSRAWCYTQDPDIRWQVCSIPFCNETGGDEALNLKMDCGTLDLNQEDYRGTVSISATGKECIPWREIMHTEDKQVEHFGGEGLEDNYCRNPHSMAKAWCYVKPSNEHYHKTESWSDMEPATWWEVCDIPSCEIAIESEQLKPGNETCKNCTKSECGSQTLRQADYTGTQNRTVSGLTCQAWDAQEPHTHSFRPTNADNLRFDLLANNYCRNPDPISNKAAWCYTTDPDTRWEYCGIPFCSEDDFVPRRSCGTKSNWQTDYRGDKRHTVTGKQCLSWDLSVEAAETNGHTSLHLPWAGLDSNYCRNPENWKYRAWCYVSGGIESFEFCDVDYCQECGSPDMNQSDYRGTQAVSRSGAPCHSWNRSQFPNSTWLDFQGWGLEGSYCRNPNGTKEYVWCFTDNSTTEWEYCDIPDCEEKGNLTCGSPSVRQADYLGQLNVTKSGKVCVDWTSLFLLFYFSPPEYWKDTTWIDLLDAAIEARNFCRNPNGYKDSAWCYTGPSLNDWDYCDVPNCVETGMTLHTHCGSQAERQADYRGEINVTASGEPCKPWKLQDEYTAELYPDAGLHDSYCRQPAGISRLGAWCFVNETELKWAYCDVPVCKNF